VQGVAGGTQSPPPKQRQTTRLGTWQTLSTLPAGFAGSSSPRSFSFDPTGRFSYCCNQWADNVTVFRVDRDKGTLTFTNQYTPVGNPSIIIFLDLAKTQR